MAFDQPTRNRLQRFVNDPRRKSSPVNSKTTLD